MNIKRYGWLFFLMVIGVSAGEIPITGFHWTIPRGHGTNRIIDGAIELRLTKPEKSSGCWQVGQPAQEIRLEGYRYLNFNARSMDDKTHLVNLYIRRRLAPGNEASFYSIIEVKPEWQSYKLQLRRSDRSKASFGFFAFTKGTKNCDIDLSKGGRLLTIQPAATASAVLQFKDFKLTTQPAETNPEAVKIAAQMEQHPQNAPYQFRKIIKPEAVGAVGFSIVIQPVAGETERFAARELAGYLQRITGKAFPVTTVPSGGRNIILAVRPSDPEEGFFSGLTDGKTLTITGNSPRALLFAVYDFLEKAAGIRWFAPFDYGEIVPSNPELKFPLFQDSSEPQISYRRLHYCSSSRAPQASVHRWVTADWCVKNRFNVELERLQNRKEIEKFYQSRGGCIWLPENPGHNFHKLIPPRKYFKTHPDFFCFDRATGKWRAERAQLCTTNPELIQELGRLADSYFQRHPDHQYFPLFQEDGHRLWCQCAPCLALNPSGSNLASASENNINLANQVCAEIRKKYPDKGVFTYAYGISCKPPVKIRPQPGVRVMYCYYSNGSPHHHPWQVSNFREILEWRRLTGGNMVIYSYHYLGPLYAFNDADTMTQMFRMFHLLGLQGSNQETSESWAGADGYQLYLGGRLAWDPWVNETELRRDYYRKFYGPAADSIQKFVELLSRTLCNRSLWLRHGLNSYRFIPANTLAEMKQLIRKAEQSAAGNARVFKAVKSQSAYLEFLEAWSKAMEAGDRYYREPSAELCQTALATVGNLRKVIRKLVPERLVSLKTIRICDAWERNLNASWKENQASRRIRERYHVICELNPWKFRTDSRAAGNRERWYAADFDDTAWKSIRSGRFWEEQGFPDYDGAAWYRIKLEIPDFGTRVGLYFGGADERAWIYLDGKYIGGHYEGDAGILWEEPFTVMFPPNTAGKHQITVKVIDSAGKGGLWKPVLLIAEK